MKNDVISPEFDENGRPLRRIRSFVRRQGRLTKGQEHALENYWPVMGVEFSEDMLDFPALFGRKARHNKRRIVQVPFAELVKSKLQLGGVFHMATDWEPYAEHMLEVMSSIDGYKNLSESNDYVPRPASRPVTKFEQRGHRLGHGVWDLMFERVK